MADSKNPEINGTENKETQSIQKEEKSDSGSGDAEITLDDKIIRQIEYYFGDINLARDKFLQEKIKLKDGWVSLDVMLTFKRLAALTTDKPKIVSALKKSLNNIIQVSEDESEIRRNPERPLPEMNEERRKELMVRTLYMKGFPITTVLDEVLEFFNKLTVVENVIMRSYKDKATNTFKFKGSVFAVFPTKDAAAMFLKSGPVKFGDQELIMLWQSDYIENKRLERLDSKLNKRKFKNADDENEEQEKKDDGFPKNAVLHFKGCPADLTREVIKDKVEELEGSVAFIDFNRGDTEGWVRLQDEGGALEFIEKLEEGKLKIGEDSIEVKVLEGEDEANYLVKVKADMAKRRNQAQRGRRGRRGGFGGRGNFGRKRKGSPTPGGETAAKVAATSDS